MSSKWFIVLVLFICILTSGFLHFYKYSEPCLNEDEASIGYNAYSVLKTGKDEYGNIPYRFQAFGENKLPATGFITIPFIYIFGLNDITVRLPTTIIGIFFPVLFYFATYSIFKSKQIGIFAAIMASTNIWLQVTSRHAHETVVMSFFVLIYITVLFWEKVITIRKSLILGALIFLSLMTYHSAKIITPFLLTFTVFYIYFICKGGLWLKLRKIALPGFILIIFMVIFAITELLSPTNRLSSLSYFTNPVFVHEIQEGRRLGGSAIFYNKINFGTYRLFTRSIDYLSPQFLLIGSDPNLRFGSEEVPLLSWIEYSLFVIGIFVSIYSVLVKRERLHLLFLLGLLFVSILPAALALPVRSSTRSYQSLIPIIILAAFGLSQLIFLFKKTFPKINYIILPVILIFSLIFVLVGWRNYFFTYLPNSDTKKAWQCGMKEISKIAWQNYSKFENINISTDTGQPYIFLLFYGAPYPPEKYQNIAKTMPYNQYGFWEQISFDKFTFNKMSKCIRGVKSLNISIKRSNIKNTELGLHPSQMENKKYTVSIDMCKTL